MRFCNICGKHLTFKDIIKADSKEPTFRCPACGHLNTFEEDSQKADATHGSLKMHSPSEQFNSTLNISTVSQCGASSKDSNGTDTESNNYYELFGLCLDMRTLKKSVKILCNVKYFQDKGEPLCYLELAEVVNCHNPARLKGPINLLEEKGLLEERRVDRKRTFYITPEAEKRYRTYLTKHNFYKESAKWFYILRKNRIKDEDTIHSSGNGNPSGRLPELVRDREYGNEATKSSAQPKNVSLDLDEIKRKIKDLNDKVVDSKPFKKRSKPSDWLIAVPL